MLSAYERIDVYQPAVWSYTWLGRRYVSIQSDLRPVWTSALSVYRPHTWRRRLYVAAARLLTIMRCERLVGRRERLELEDLAGIPIRKWLRRVVPSKEVVWRHVAVAYPVQEDRLRRYAYILGDCSSVVGFAKIALSTPEVSRLRLEGEVLRGLQGSGMGNLRVPELLGYREEGERAMLVVRAVPAGATPMPVKRWAQWRSAFARLMGEPSVVQPKEAHRVSWWKALQDSGASRWSGFWSDVQARLQTPILVSRAHGDLGPANVLEEGRVLWVLDWESAVADAPHLADDVGYWLAEHTRQIACDSRRALNKLGSYVRGICPAARPGDIALAVAFRLACGHKEARALAEAWRCGLSGR